MGILRVGCGCTRDGWVYWVGRVGIQGVGGVRIPEGIGTPGGVISRGWVWLASGRYAFYCHSSPRFTVVPGLYDVSEETRTESGTEC